MCVCVCVCVCVRVGGWVGVDVGGLVWVWVGLCEKSECVWGGDCL